MRTCSALEAIASIGTVADRFQDLDTGSAKQLAAKLDGSSIVHAAERFQEASAAACASGLHTAFDHLAGGSV